MIRALALLALLVPAIAAATPAQITASWSAVENAASYSLACGFAPNALTEIASTPTTSATGDVVLPTDSGTVYCAVTAMTASGLMSEPSQQLQGFWDIAEVAPEPPVLIEIGVTVDCPEGFECAVTLSP